MRLLFEIDRKDYDINGTKGIRPSSRGIIIKGTKIAMVYSKVNNYYKFPGGGIEAGETHVDSLIREVKEEAGLKVIKESIKEYGYVHRIQKGKHEDVFIQDNYYYFCEVIDGIFDQELEEDETLEEFVLEYVEPQKAIKINREGYHYKKENNPLFDTMSEREARVLEYLLKEGYFSSI